ncbi:MAG: ABC transporter ATP-binding protein [Opitutales bacterium]|nr:ABC transporter ATP-binding protein [Opitutales bacterium]
MLKPYYFIRNFLFLVSRALGLAVPFGRKRMALVFSLILAQGVFQVIGVASIFPFLALASNPERMTDHRVAEIIRVVLPNLDARGLLLVAGIGAVAVLLLSNAINMASEFGRTRYSLSLGQWLRVRLMIRVSRRNYAYFLQTNPSILMKKVGGDVSGFISGVFLPLLDVFVRIICISLLLLLLLAVDPVIAVGAIVVFGSFYLSLLVLLKATTRRISTELKGLHRGASKALYQFLSGIKVVTIHDQSEYFIGAYDRITKRTAKIATIIPVISNLPRYLIEPVAFGGLVIVVMVLSLQGRDMQELIPVLGVMAFAGYRLLPALQFLYGGLTGIMTQKHTMEEVYDELSGPEPAPLPRKVEPLHFRHALELNNVRFTYEKGGPPVLDGVSFKLEKGKSLGVVGSTGSGKSTLIDLIMGLHWPTNGRMLLDGKVLGPADIRSWRRIIGYVPQDIFLLDETIAANIAFGIPVEAVDTTRLREAAQSAQILGFIENELPAGFETTVGDRGVRLSGGQRQRIGLARALYLRPEVLVLDEATSALDNETEAALMRSVESIGGQVTKIMVAHRLSTVRRCDEIIFLERGVIRARGPYDTLVATDERFQELVRDH